MYRDRDEELQRLQEQLLEEEEEAEAPAEEEDALLDEETVDALLDGDRPAGDHRVYQNYSNDYGKQLRNYASGYKAYNTDTTDTDLEYYSEKVRQPKCTCSPAVLVAVLLFTVAIVLIMWWCWMHGGCG